MVNLKHSHQTLLNFNEKCKINTGNLCKRESDNDED